MKIKLENSALVVLVGAMGVGKSTFCHTHFPSHYLVSSDKIREELTGDFENQDVNQTVFEILYATVEARLKVRLFTVVDSTGSNRVLDRCKKLSERLNVPFYILRFPALDKSELTEERMKHRMKYLYAYHRQVARIEMTRFPETATIIDLPKNGFGVDISITDSAPDHLIPDDQYVVVPDLHGCCDVLRNTVETHPDKKFIVLGDIVDRGADSYGTFRVVNALRDEGRLYAVPGNHDDKLTRYFKKWLADTDYRKYEEVGEFDNTPSYGMRIAYGLDVTLRQFYSLGIDEMDSYAIDFIEYYNSLPLYLRLERTNEVHYFAHAGISPNVAHGMPLLKKDVSTCLYGPFGLEVHTERHHLQYLERMFERRKGDVTVHVGHYAKESRVVVDSLDGRIKLVYHDIGIGKRFVGANQVNFWVV